MKLQSYWVFFIVSALSVGGFVGLLAFNEISRNQTEAAMPIVDKPLPDFQLTTHTGGTLKRNDLLGKVWIADFIFTTCPGPCLQMSHQMEAIQDQLQNIPNTRLVSITVSPEVDTPEVLAKYGQRFNAGENWIFLTGARKDIYGLAVNGFQLSVVDTGDGSGRPEDQFIHSTKLAVVDQQGDIRAYYDGIYPDTPHKVVAEVRRLMAVKVP